MIIYPNRFFSLFMGPASAWYKGMVIALLVLNPLLLFIFGSFVTGWAVLVEFLLILALSLECYPLFTGGLLALELLFLRMVTVEDSVREIALNLNVLMLLIFLVPAIFFMRPLLGWIFMGIFAATKDKVVLSLVFLTVGAFLAAWLDALTVVAVMIAVCASAEAIHAKIAGKYRDDAEEFRGFLRNLLMHGAMGTALGGIATLVGQPQNVLIGHYAGWGFQDFYIKMMRFSIPLQLSGLVLCWVLERFRLKVFGFGYQIPPRVAAALEEEALHEVSERGPGYKTRLVIMAATFVCFMLALGMQIAPVGMVGLGLLIVLPTVTGQVDDHKVGKAFEEPLPFAALLAVFFVIVAMIEAQGLFHPVIEAALKATERGRVYAFFFASGILSSVSDNVFVASIYMHQTCGVFEKGLMNAAQFDYLSRAINLGTNIFSVATPNGQSAFLFLLTSTIARKIGLSYWRMLVMSFPYAVVLIAVSWVML